MILTNYVCSMLLIAIGLYCVVCKNNIFKIVIGMGVIDYGVNLLIVSIGFNPGGSAPIFTATELSRDMFFVDPVPQALTLTSIVIGACVTAMAMAIVIKLKQKYGTLDTEKIRRIHG